VLKAPEDGIVTRVPTPPVPLFVIAVDDKIEVEVEVGSIDVPKLNVGQDTRLVVIETGQQLSGRVRLAPAGVDQKQLGKGRVSLTDKDPTLRMGMFVRGIITVATREGISIPSSAISHTGEGSVVNVVRDSVIEKRYVKTGLNMEDNNGEGRTEILPCSPCAPNEGLKGDELVVANAGSSVREGTRVKAVEASSQRRGL
jgi:HlyD family secretion protein